MKAIQYTFVLLFVALLTTFQPYSSAFAAGDDFETESSEVFKAYLNTYLSNYWGENSNWAENRLADEVRYFENLDGEAQQEVIEALQSASTSARIAKEFLSCDKICEPDAIKERCSYLVDLLKRVPYRGLAIGALMFAVGADLAMAADLSTSILNVLSLFSGSCGFLAGYVLDYDANRQPLDGLGKKHHLYLLNSLYDAILARNVELGER